MAYHQKSKDEYLKIISAVRRGKKLTKAIAESGITSPTFYRMKNYYASKEYKSKVNLEKIELEKRGFEIVNSEKESLRYVIAAVFLWALVYTWLAALTLYLFFKH